jgi:hypothetical protein
VKNVAKKTTEQPETSAVSFEVSDQVLNAVIAQQKSASAACLQLFLKMAAGHIPSGDELALLYSQGFDAKYKIEEEVAKRRVTLELKKAAGTRAEREELRKRAAAAKAAFNAEASQIEEEIREFTRVKQARVDELGRAVAEPQAKLEAMEHAVKALQSERQLPLEVETTYRALRGRIQEKFADFRRAETVAETMRGRLALAEKVAQFVGKRNLAVSHDVRDLLNSQQLHGEDGTIVNPAKLAQFKEKSERKLQEAEAIIAHDREEYAKQMSEIEKSKEFWLD